MAFVTSAALAGGAGALYGLNFSNLVSSKFDFNTSILILVFVVLGGLGNMWGSIIAAAVLTVLPEALRGFARLPYAHLRDSPDSRHAGDEQPPDEGAAFKARPVRQERRKGTCLISL